MNKKCFILLNILLSGCQYISYNEVIPLAKQAIIGLPDIELTDDFISQQRYSFARLDLGRGANVIMVLSEIENNFYTWISASGEKIITYNGKIVRTYGLVYNMELINPNTFKIFSPKNNYKGIYNVFLNDPEAFIEQRFSTYLSKENNKLKLEESIEIDILDLKYTNLYFVDPVSGRTIRSIQTIHPKLPKIEIDFIYK